jgi:DNA helicase-2/ATP-dependent DNA helicase PcrA
LWLTYANARYRFGNLTQNDASRFLEELPEQYLDRSFAGGGAKNQGNNNMGSAYARMHRGYEPSYGDRQTTTEAKPTYINTTPKPQTVAHIPSPDFTASDTSGLQVGQQVEHQKFGFGEVIKMEGSAHNPIATVKFQLNGEKKIMLNYAKLRIVQ